MRASGTLRVAGKTVALSGESWFDHQWGDYADDPPEPVKSGETVGVRI
jgi:predicted secreted hydrolase